MKKPEGPKPGPKTAPTPPPAQRSLRAWDNTRPFSPVELHSEPAYTELDEASLTLARSVGMMFSGKSSIGVSQASHVNPGWLDG